MKNRRQEEKGEGKGMKRGTGGRKERAKKIRKEGMKNGKVEKTKKEMKDGKERGRNSKKKCEEEQE